MSRENSININELLKKMTLSEKIGQLLQIAPFLFSDSQTGAITGPMSEMGLSAKEIQLAGSILGISGAKEMIELQTNYLAKNDKKIPLLVMADVIHGYRTIFPVPLAIGCSWDAELAELCARVSGKEAAAGGVHVTFSPMADLVRDARWGRVMESTGEDPLLNALFARAFVKGYQNGDILKDDSVAACVKHFAAYGAAEGGRDYNTVDMSERTLREYYLPAYKAALDEGAQMVMTAFNTVEGVPPSGNEWLMRDVLRSEWKFEGTVISDWGAVSELIPHGVAADKKEAAEKAIKAGVDIEMMTTCYTHHLEELIAEGKISEALLDESVYRILKLKEDLGLFDNPFKGANIELENALILSDAHMDAVRKVAQNSMVLLKNDGVLPIKSDVKTVALIGPYAENGSLLGPWSWAGKIEESVTIAKGIENKIGRDNLLIAKGCDIEGTDKSHFLEAIEIAKKADFIVLALGEDEQMSGEGCCRTDITLPGVQLDLVKEIVKLNKPTVTVLINGRPLDIRELTELSPAILESWFPGTQGGNAIADILFGEFNPSAKLSMSFPFNVGQSPVYYNCYNTGRPKVSEESTVRYCSHYIDAPNAPLYPFGYGLSYSKFVYSPLKSCCNVLNSTSLIKLSVDITNNSSVDGVEIVQLYIRDITGEVVRPVKELKGFEKVMLKAGETKTVTFKITEDMLRYTHRNFELKSDAGKFHAFVGPNSRDTQIFEFELV